MQHQVIVQGIINWKGHKEIWLWASLKFLLASYMLE